MPAKHATVEAPQRRPNARRRGARGQGVTEFALVLPLLMLVLVGIAESGSYALSMLSLTNATHEAGRLASLSSTVRESAVRERVLESAGPAALTANDIRISVNDGRRSFAARRSGDTVRVETRLAYRPLLAGVLGDGLTITLRAESSGLVH